MIFETWFLMIDSGLWFHASIYSINICCIGIIPVFYRIVIGVISINCEPFNTIASNNILSIIAVVIIKPKSGIYTSMPNIEKFAGN
jgi:hypothetical protein